MARGSRGQTVELKTRAQVYQQQSGRRIVLSKRLRKVDKQQHVAGPRRCIPAPPAATGWCARPGSSLVLGSFQEALRHAYALGFTSFVSGLPWAHSRRLATCAPQGKRAGKGHAICRAAHARCAPPGTALCAAGRRLGAANSCQASPHRAQLPKLGPPAHRCVCAASQASAPQAHTSRATHTPPHRGVCDVAQRLLGGKRRVRGEDDLRR